MVEGGLGGGVVGVVCGFFKFFYIMLRGWIINIRAGDATVEMAANPPTDQRGHVSPVTYVESTGTFQFFWKVIGKI